MFKTKNNDDHTKLYITVAHVSKIIIKFNVYDL